MKQLVRITFFLSGFVFLMTSCSNQEDSKILKEVEAQNIDIKIDRFDRTFANAEASDLPELKKEYPYFFNPNVQDSLWIDKMNDSLQNEINSEVAEAFESFSEEKKDIERFFKYVKHYFPQVNKPTVLTLAESVDYKNKAVVVDTLLFVSLDNYLGKDHKFYMDFETYISQYQDKKYMLSDIALTYAESLTPKADSRQFISKMIYYGKLLYFKDITIPFESDAVKIHYTEDQMNWAKNNEKQTWQHFVEQEMIYSTKTDLNERFINLAPFSKFYLGVDNESSPRIGQYIGWQIVRDFMKENPEVSPAEMLQMKAIEIFNKANYKP
ncbi:gliding motility lipoprotein GldB [Psychroflexus halocasei]|uniref:Gliding motility-associated lipoprotein GldB n=1 Tax=Psychroflexus halocasei TaxID=908615 RepID=A0A1H3XL39_9FLAO|nr:gliding motility lipoprotein GldB [Psychroflexus halocasei]SDZ99312.1 gliding motility-associated lipoprotein GldB [Psychroflexus halocasei]